MKYTPQLTQLLLLLAILSTACQGQVNKADSQQASIAPKAIIHYTLHQASATSVLPEQLNEISGLAYNDSQSVYAINDEQGIVFAVNTQTGKILSQQRFGKDADYEGISTANGYIYVLKSNGNIYKLQADANKPQTEKISSPLNSDNDCEGLCFDASKNRLLIACKANAGIGKRAIKGRAVYAYSLGNGKWQADAALVFKPKSIAKQQGIAKKSKNKLRNFAPSAIAIHPISGHWYLLGHKGKNLMVFDNNGQFVASSQLDKSIFWQAEGLCFAPNGDMYISNEKQQKNANLLKFSYIP